VEEQAVRGMSLVTSRRSEDGASDGGSALVRLYLSGGFHAFRGDEAIPSALWDRHRAARTVIKILAMAPGHRMHREQVLEFVWPDVGLSERLNRLGKALHATRRVLEPDLLPRAPSAYLKLEGELLSLHPVNVWIDADKFEFLAQSALESGSLLALDAVNKAYGGELLPEDCYADWAMPRQDSVRTLYLDVLNELAAAREQAGQYRQAIGHVQEALSIDNTLEETHRFLIRLYALDGKRDRALRQFGYLKEMLQRELSIAPTSETLALCTAIREGTFPPPRITSIRAEGTAS
jgi:DNA-binding SARP family transcriptional activator